MSFGQIISILQARRMMIIILFVLIAPMGFVISLFMTKQYEASTSLIFNVKGVDPVSGMNATAQMMPGYVATQADVIKSKRVALKVVRELGLSTNPKYVRDYMLLTNGKGAQIEEWLANKLLDNVRVTPSRESNVVYISYVSPDPSMSASVANMFARSYIMTNIELRAEPAKQSAEWYKTQIQELKNNVEDAQAKLTAYKAKKNIIFDGSDPKFSVESARLAQLNTSLVTSEQNLFDLKTKLAAIDRRNVENTDTDIIDDPLINQLKVSIANLELKFAEIKQRLSSQHPDYRSAQAELASMKSRFQRELLTVRDKLKESVRREAKIVAELKSRVQEQKERLMALNADRDQQDVLQRDVEVSKMVLSTAMQRFNQQLMESQANQADVAVLTEATPPMSPSKPNILVNTFIFVFLGVIFSVSFVLFLEFVNRKVRTKMDIEDSLEIPVLGNIPKIKYNKKARLV